MASLLLIASLTVFSLCIASAWRAEERRTKGGEWVVNGKRFESLSDARDWCDLVENCGGDGGD